MGTFLRHEPCPNCGSSDALGRYADGSAYCFGCQYHEKGDGSGDEDTPSSHRQLNKDFLQGEYRAIKSRSLSEESCKKFGYQIGKLGNGELCHIAPYYNADGVVVAQKIRPTDKNKMFTIGSMKDALLFGQYVNRNQGKRIVITEGEIDCISVAQTLGHGWPVVSVPTGAQSAAKALKKHLEWLEGFEEIVLMFDMDEVGQKAAKECAQVFSPGKARIASLPLKDPSEMLQAGRVKELNTAVFDARPYRPDGIRTFADVAEEAKAPTQIGLPWYLDALTKLTYGRRYGELAIIGGGTGCGKTDFIMEQVCFDVMKLGEKVGLFFFEQQNFETAKRLAGKHASKPFHIPEERWTQKQLDKAVSEIASTDRVFLYNHFGQTDWDIIKSRMRFLAVNSGVRLFYIDNLTSLADPANERESLETLMGEVAMLAQELNVWVFLVSHLTAPATGSTHEEGGHVSLRHFKGARAIGFWVSFAFGLERNKVAEDPQERLRATLRCVKDRYTGRADGECVELVYDQETCRLGPFKGTYPLPTPDFSETDKNDARALAS